jgi:hypothetical protein
MNFAFSPPIEHIARWDGANWHDFGTFDGPVESFTLYGSELIAGGNFKTIDGDSTVGIARWDGANWLPYGSGLHFYTTYTIHVNAMTVYEGDLVIGGMFSHVDSVEALRIARWDGTDWYPLGSGLNAVVYAFAVYDNDLYVGGVFTEAGGVSVPGLARWDGSDWHKLEGSYITSGSSEVRSFATYDNELYIGGWFEYTLLPGSIICSSLVRWDGVILNPVEPALGGSPDVTIYDLEVYHNELYAVAWLGHPSAYRSIRRYDGYHWRNLGSGFPGLYPEELGVVNDELVVGSFEGGIASWNKPPTCCVGQSGNIDGDPGYLIDISDLVYLVDFMFSGGAAPPCMLEANVDGLGELDISDLVYLVDYMFTGGPAPVACP